MKTYEWTCAACTSPNVLVCDTSKEGQVSLNCRNCGEPGKFSREEKKVTLLRDNLVCSTTYIDSTSEIPLYYTGPIHWTQY